MKQKTKSQKWFRKVRGSYLPCSWQGGLLYAVYTAYILGVVAYVVANNYDKLQAVFWVFPNWVAALAVMTWIAQRKS